MKGLILYDGFTDTLMHVMIIKD